MGVHTYARINLQAMSQLTPAKYNSDPHRLALLSTHAKCPPPPNVPRFICMRTPAHATCDNMHDPSHKKWGDGASQHGCRRQIREETLSDAQSKCRKSEDSVWRQRSAVNNTAHI